MEFAYSNLSDRAPGALLRAAALVLPGVRTVQRQVEPIARAWQQANRAALAGPASVPLWVAIGDSMTQGIGASDIAHSWVGRLQTRLAAAGRPYRVVNLSTSGARLQDVLDRQLPALRTLPGAPALVTVLIGSNDVFSRRHRAGAAERMTRVLAGLPHPAVVGNLPNPSRTARALSAAVQDAATRPGVVLADLRDPRTTSWRGKLASDFFHPNDRGYADIAAVFGEAIEASAVVEHPGPVR